MMKKVLFVVIPSLLLALLIFLGAQLFTQYRSLKGALQVTSSPVSKVYLNNMYLGQTPLCKCEASDMLKVGEYTIRMVPVDSNLSEFQEKITVSESVLTVVDRKFEKDSLSEGSVISLTPLSDKKKMELLVASFPQGAEVSLDNNPIGTTPLLHKNPTESDHILKVKKNGYKEKTIRIRTTMGYKLTIAVYLSTSSSGSSVSQKVSVPSPTSSQPIIVILDTPTGFLRVRDSSSAGGVEIGRVNPGEEYPLLDEQTGWFEIKMPDGKIGWISSQYAQKKQ